MGGPTVVLSRLYLYGNYRLVYCNMVEYGMVYYGLVYDYMVECSIVWYSSIV